MGPGSEVWEVDVEVAEELPLVGRMGGTPVAVVVVMAVEMTVVVEDEGKGAQELRAQTRSVGQQPPPKLAAQDWTLRGHAELVEVETIVLRDVLVRVEDDAKTVKVCVITVVTTKEEFMAPEYL